MTWLAYDQALIDGIANRLALRTPNKAAVSAVIERITGDDFHEVVCNLATGVGKTYIMAALVDYLAARGVRDVLIVTPGKTIQDKTIANFTSGSRKEVPGMDAVPYLVTPENLRTGRTAEALDDPAILKLFVFNVQQLVGPSLKGARRFRTLDEVSGTNLHSYLRHVGNLVIIADEHHVYRSQAKRFSAAVRGLQPRALVGLTATPDPADEAKVVFRYTLGDAIADKLVKIPVIVYRQDGHKDMATQLADACHLLAIKAVAYDAGKPVGEETVHPVLFAVCQSVQDAGRATAILRQADMIGDPAAVLEVTSQSSDEALAALASVEEPDSPVRAVVSVDKLKEGWDVKNIAVIVAYRALASQTLTEQILGRGLRLPYGKRTEVDSVDQVDIIAHDSYKRLLEQKDALIQRVIPSRARNYSAGPAASEAQDDYAAEADLPVTEQASEGTIRLVFPPRPGDGGLTAGAVALKMQEFGATAEHARQDAQSKLLQRVPNAPRITFPRRERKVIVVQFSLSDVTDGEARAAGAAFASEIAVPLVREAINVRRTPEGGLRVDIETLPPETATQQWLTVAQVQSHLQARILGFSEVMQTRSEANAALRISKAFLTGAGVSVGHDVDWSAARAGQAGEGLYALIRHKMEAHRPPPEFDVRPVLIPAEKRQVPTDVLDRRSPFEKNRWYSGWTKSVLTAVRFDAETTEFALAHIMDGSRAVTWWLRLEKEDQAIIELDDGYRYHPDFIAIDENGVTWVVEGKRNRDAEAFDTRKKKAAAEKHLRYVSDFDVYGEWRYLFCTETAIRRARGSWDALVAAAGGLL